VVDANQSGAAEIAAGPEDIKAEGLRFGALGDHWVHVCVDMQRMFAEETPWHTAWIPRVIPNVASIIELDPARTIFTRFIPPRRPEEASGTWRRYYQRWEMMTRDRLDPGLIEIVPELARYLPPAQLADKAVLSPWSAGLAARLEAGLIDTIIVTGAETEVCVLATVMGAIDRGYRVVIVTDAICSSADETHDAMMKIYQDRFNMQVETVTAAQFIGAWIDESR
jgi:nicotinamidase-related amidase